MSRSRRRTPNFEPQYPPSRYQPSGTEERWSRYGYPDSRGWRYDQTGQHPPMSIAKLNTNDNNYAQNRLSQGHYTEHQGDHGPHGLYSNIDGYWDQRNPYSVPPPPPHYSNFGHMPDYIPPHSHMYNPSAQENSPSMHDSHPSAPYPPSVSTCAKMPWETKNYPGENDYGLQKYYEERMKLDEERKKHEDTITSLQGQQKEMESDLAILRHRLEMELQQQNTSPGINDAINEKISAIENQIMELNAKLSNTDEKLKQSEAARLEIHTKLSQVEEKKNMDSSDGSNTKACGETEAIDPLLQTSANMNTQTNVNEESKNQIYNENEQVETKNVGNANQNNTKHPESDSDSIYSFSMENGDTKEICDSEKVTFNEITPAERKDCAEQENKSTSICKLSNSDVNMNEDLCHVVRDVDEMNFEEKEKMWGNLKDSSFATDFYSPSLSSRKLIYKKQDSIRMEKISSPKLWTKECVNKDFLTRTEENIFETEEDSSPKWKIKKLAVKHDISRDHDLSRASTSITMTSIESHGDLYKDQDDYLKAECDSAPKASGGLWSKILGKKKEKSVDSRYSDIIQGSNLFRQSTHREKNFDSSRTCSTRNKHAEEGWCDSRTEDRRSLLEGLGTTWCVVPDIIWKHLGDENDSEPITRKKCVAFILGVILIVLLIAIILGLIIGLATSLSDVEKSPIRFVVIPGNAND